jgi:hypothetical protein
MGRLMIRQSLDGVTFHRNILKFVSKNVFSAGNRKRFTSELTSIIYCQINIDKINDITVDCKAMENILKKENVVLLLCHCFVYVLKEGKKIIGKSNPD